MTALSEFLGSHMALVFFVYGLAWFVMSVAILLSTHKSLSLVLTRNIYWLAGFGLFHGLVEWIDMLLLWPSEISPLSMNPFVPTVKIGLLVLSTLLLLRFGFGMVYGFIHSRIVILLPVVLIVLWLTSPLYASFLITGPDVSLTLIAADSQASCLRCHSSIPDLNTSASITNPTLKATLEVFTRYLLYFPGLLLSGIGFYLMARLFRKSGLSGLARDSYLTAGVMIVNSFFAGLVVAPSPFLLGSLFNYHNFFSITGMPPQVFRALMAIATSFFIVRVLRVYRMEQDRQLEQAREQRLRAQEQLSRELGATVSELTQELTELHKFGERVISGTDFGRVLQGLTEVTTRLLQCDGGAVYLLSDEQSPYLASAYGICVGQREVPVEILNCIHRSDTTHSIEVSGVLMGGVMTGVQEERGSILLAPMLSRDGLMGVVSVYARSPRTFSESDSHLLETISGQAAIALHNTRLYSRLSEQSIRDGLTGIYNHRYFQERLEEEVTRATITSSPISLLFIDVDSFKIFNDANGHPMGDQILQEIARTIKACGRATDIAARYGGEEFVLLLPSADTIRAVGVAERIRSRVARHVFLTSSAIPVRVTVSIGVASFPKDAHSKDELIDKADWAMYSAKRKGKNQTCAFSVDGEYTGCSKPEESVPEDLYHSTVYALAAAVDARDRYTSSHSERVAHYASAIAKHLNLTGSEIIDLNSAALLHDVGKIGIRDDILNKPGPLTPQEWSVIKEHPKVGEDILKHVRSLIRIISSVRYHHERFDGRGYPDGLIGEEIPLGARIIAVADAFHSMCSDRPYRAALSVEQATAEMRANAGSQFDPSVVEAFLAALEQEKAEGTRLVVPAAE